MSEGEMITASEIQTIIEDGFYTSEDDTTEPAREGWYDLEEALTGRYDYRNKKYLNGPVEIKGVGTVAMVENFGGEGLGDEMYMVFSVDDRLFRIDGYYSSYGGSEWDSHGSGLREVTAQQRTITVYE